MRIEQRAWTREQGWTEPGTDPLLSAPQLVLVFGAGQALADPALLRAVEAMYPGALRFGCSTAGEVDRDVVRDESLAVTAVRFDHTTIASAACDLDACGDMAATGKAIASRLPREGLRHVLLLSDGLHVNGTALANSLMKHLPPGVTVTGGLAADGPRFQQTLVLLGDEARPRIVAAVGLYSDRLRLGFGSRGGWDPFGPERIITRSRGNVLYEMDGGSALALYKKYLGKHAAGLPATGLLFPLSLKGDDSDADGMVRTLLAVNEEDQSMTFAGDMPEGSRARLMKANLDRLVDGAHRAAVESLDGLDGMTPAFALCISCVGRKLIMKQRVEEEVEAVRGVYGPDAAIAGFYSYGEISPTPTGTCGLHNQTMTITTFAEI
ncbi:MAG: FIST signal transduction protein [Desulfovibrionaceae bacterium]